MIFLDCSNASYGHWPPAAHVRYYSAARRAKHAPKEPSEFCVPAPLIYSPIEREFVREQVRSRPEERRPQVSAGVIRRQHGQYG